MASGNSLLTNWLKNAYSMELGLAPVLERQIAEVAQDPELAQGLKHHVQQTRSHAELLKGCLQRMGENVRDLRPGNPLSGFYGQADGAGPDAARQAELMDFVTEEFEVASYRALSALATMAGDADTARVCQQILQDELAITRALSRRIPGDVEDGTDNGRIARETFDALNAHDMLRFDQFTTGDFHAENPGVPGPMTREQNRQYMEAYFKAFPDLHFDVERVVAAGADAVVRWTATGTHTGPLRSVDGLTIPPTSRKGRVRGATTYTFHNRRIQQAWVNFDTMELLQQLGLVPGSEPAPLEARNRSITHLEIPAHDRAEMADFYREMFGWEMNHLPDPANYTMFRAGNVAGGFLEMGETYRAGEVLLYVDSLDLELDVKRAERLGAQTLVPPTEIPGFGRYAILADPTGNRIGLYKAAR